LLKKPVMLCRCTTTLNASETTGLCPLPQPQAPSRAAGSFVGKVRSFTLADGRLNLALEADAGIHVWEPVADGD
jgi:hypothetical protein